MKYQALSVLDNLLLMLQYVGKIKWEEHIRLAHGGVVHQVNHMTDGCDTSGKLTSGKIRRTTTRRNSGNTTRCNIILLEIAAIPVSHNKHVSLPPHNANIKCYEKFSELLTNSITHFILFQNKIITHTIVLFFINAINF